MTPKTEFEVGGIRRTVRVQAVIDTGFDGELCIPVGLAVTLGLELVGQDLVELADGSQKHELLFAGSVRFLGKKRRRDIYLTNGDEALIGTTLLADCRLSVDFGTGSVRVVRRPRRPGRG